MPRKKSDLETLLERLEIPDCGCEPFRDCPCREPCDCPLHLKQEPCEHVAQAGDQLTWAEWRELLEGMLGDLPSGKPLDVVFWREALERTFGHLSHADARFHGEPPPAPAAMDDVISKEATIVILRDRDTEGYALSRPGDFVDPRAAAKIDRKAARRPGNHHKCEGGLVYHLHDATEPTPDEAWDPVLEREFEHYLKRVTSGE